MSQLKSLIRLTCRAGGVAINELGIYLIIVGICCASCAPNDSISFDDKNLTAVTSNFTAGYGNHHPSQNLTMNTTAKSSSHLSNSSVEDYDDYYYDSEEAKRIRANSKIAQIVVYFSVIMIALAGVMIKYFVTQYESSQLKAQEQLNYQRLQNA